MKIKLITLTIVFGVVCALCLSACSVDQSCAASYGGGYRSSGSYGGGYKSGGYSSTPKSYGSSSGKSYSSPQKTYSTPNSSSPKNYGTHNGVKSIPRTDFNSTRTSAAPGYQRAWDPVNHIYYWFLISELTSHNNDDGC